MAGWIAVGVRLRAGARRSRRTSAEAPRGARAAAGAGARPRSRDFRAFARESVCEVSATASTAPADAAALLYAIARVRERGGLRRALSSRRASAPRTPTSARLLSRVARDLIRLDYRPALGRRGASRRTPPSASSSRTRPSAPPASAGTCTCAGWCAATRLDFGLWPGIPTEPPRHPDRHAHSPRLAAPGTDAAQDRRLEGGAPDHAARSRGSTRAIRCASTTRFAASASSASAARTRAAVAAATSARRRAEAVPASGGERIAA